MAQRQAEVELSYLERVSPSRWRFRTNPHPPFDQLIDHLIASHLFQIRQVHFTLGSGNTARKWAYEINEEGIWFLSHLFRNWTEMQETDEALRKKTESHTHQSLPRCSRCGEACSTECVHCHKPYCEQCYNLHEFNRRYEGSTQQTFHFRFNFQPSEGINDFLRYAFQQETTQGTFIHTFTQAPTIPADVRDAHHLLGITQEKPTEAEIKAAFRAKVKQAATGNGNYQGDMDALTRAKERALQFAGVH